MAGITGAGLIQLQQLTQLQELSLGETMMTDAGLICLKGLTTLSSLNLRDTKVTDAGLAHLAPLTQLRFLDVSDTPVTDAGVQALRQSLPNVEVDRAWARFRIVRVTPSHAHFCTPLAAMPKVIDGQKSSVHEQPHAFGRRPPDFALASLARHSGWPAVKPARRVLPAPPLGYIQGHECSFAIQTPLPPLLLADHAVACGRHRRNARLDAAQSPRARQVDSGIREVGLLCRI